MLIIQNIIIMVWRFWNTRFVSARHAGKEDKKSAKSSNKSDEDKLEFPQDGKVLLIWTTLTKPV